MKIETRKRDRDRDWFTQRKRTERKRLREWLAEREREKEREKRKGPTPRHDVGKGAYSDNASARCLPGWCSRRGGILAVHRVTVLVLLAPRPVLGIQTVGYLVFWAESATKGYIMAKNNVQPVSCLLYTQVLKPQIIHKQRTRDLN